MILNDPIVERLRFTGSETRNPFDVFRQIGNTREERVCNIFVMSYIKLGICGMSEPARGPKTRYLFIYGAVSLFCCHF